MTGNERLYGRRRGGRTLSRCGGTVLPDIEDRFGRPIDLDAIRRVPVHMVVGGEDTDTFEINNPGESNWLDG